MMTSETKQIFVPNTSLYRLSPEEFAFFSSQTGITDEEELKNHIIAVATQAFDVSAPHCHSIIPSNAFNRMYIDDQVSLYWAFLVFEVREYCLTANVLFNVLTTRLDMSGLSTYPHLLDIGRELKNPIFLDIGCCCRSLSVK